MDRVGGSGTSQPLSKPARNPRGSALRGSALRDSDPKDRTPKDRAPKDRSPKDRAPKDSDPRGRAQALRRTAALSLNSNGIQSNCVSTEIQKVCNAMALFDSPRGPPLAPTGLAHPAAMDPPAPLPRSPAPPLPRSGAPAPARLRRADRPTVLALRPRSSSRYGPPGTAPAPLPLAHHPAPRRWNPWPGGHRSERIGPNSIGPGRGLGGHVVW
jgi:hypothetical protein